MTQQFDPLAFYATKPALSPSPIPYQKKTLKEKQIDKSEPPVKPKRLARSLLLGRILCPIPQDEEDNHLYLPGWKEKKVMGPQELVAQDSLDQSELYRS